MILIPSHSMRRLSPGMITTCVSPWVWSSGSDKHRCKYSSLRSMNQWKGYTVGEMNDKVTVLIADEDTLAREGLKNMLQAKCFEIVSEASDRAALDVAVRKHQPHVVIIES